MYALNFLVFILLCFSVTNIKYWMRSDAIIPKTLQLLSDLSVGYPFLTKLDPESDFHNRPLWRTGNASCSFFSFFRQYQIFHRSITVFQAYNLKTLENQNYRSEAKLLYRPYLKRHRRSRILTKIL